MDTRWRASKGIFQVSDFGFQPSIDKRQILELATMRFLKNAENVVFLGPPGVGKTHLATAIGTLAAQNRYSTYYVNCHALIDMLKRSHYENRLSEKILWMISLRISITSALVLSTTPPWAQAQSEQAYETVIVQTAPGALRWTSLPSA